MQIPIRYDTGDGPVDVVAGPWQVMLYERRYKTKATKWATEPPGLEEVAFLAYEATKAAGTPVPARFDEWAATLVTLDAGGDDAAPFPPALSAGSSPSSP